MALQLSKIIPLGRFIPPPAQHLELLKAKSDRPADVRQSLYKSSSSKIFLSKLIIASLVGAGVTGVSAGNSAAQVIKLRELSPNGMERPTEVDPLILDGLATDRLPTNKTSVAPSSAVTPAVSFPQLTEAVSPAAQAPPVIEAPPTEGEAPSLQTQPAAPGQQPFQPTRIPFRPRERSQTYRASPGITALTPSGYGKSWGSTGIGLGLQERTRYTDTADGVMGVGMGFGDAGRTVGLDIGVTITDLINNTAQDGTISFKLHRRLPNDFGVAVGVQNLINWGSTDGGTSVYGVVTKRFRLADSVKKPFSQLYVSAGIGNGQYRSESNIQNDVDSVGLFGSVALRVAEPVNLLVEWTGQDLTVGLPFVPLRHLPLVVTPALTDITGSAGDGARFTIGIGYGFSFK